MSATILIPTPLRPYTDKQDSLTVQATTVGEALKQLTKQYEQLSKHLFSDQGRLRSYVNIYVNDEDIRYLQREDTPLKDGDTVSIVPSVAGGAPATPVDELPPLLNDEIVRYSRHLLIPEV